MPRKVRDTNLETRTARSRLRVAHDPYYRLIEPGLHLGYRKLSSGPGTWVVRRRAEGKYTVKNLVTADGGFVIADDFSEPDGNGILSFAQAQERAKATIRPGMTGGAYTVGRAMDDYLAHMDATSKGAADARWRDRVFIRPHFEGIEIDRVTAGQIRKWHHALAKAAPRLRTRPGEAQNYRKVGRDDETIRRRRASANRVLTALKAGLNFAWREGKAVSDREWRRVKPFENVDAARARYLTVEEARRLINASAPDFQQLVQGALQTGCRYGELIRLVVGDFDRDNNTVAVRMSKTGKPRHVVLSDEGVQLLRQLCAGRPHDELIFRKSSSEPWAMSHQARPMAEACRAGRINPPIGFHGLRHSYASAMVMRNAPLLVIARNLGHSDTRMVEKHYGHLAPSYVADAIRAAAPRFGISEPEKIVPLGAPIS